jgi:hypothetical protein
MREYELIIDEALKKGLSPYESAPTNSQFLYDCLGVRCGKIGIEKFKTLTNPLSSLTYSWPYPQFIVGEKFNLLVVKVGSNQLIYSVSNDHLTSTLLCTIPEGWLVEVADFGAYALITNGIQMYNYIPDSCTWDELFDSINIPLMGTLCNFKGQVVGGNIQSEYYIYDSTYYAWSKIGYMNFSLDTENEAGYRRCPFGGDVYHTRRLGDSVIGYSSKGVTMLVPVNDPASTFGFKELVNIGLINRGAINGDNEQHVFVGEDLIVRSVTKEGIKELGYQWLMDEINDETIIVSFDPSNRDFYIGNSTKTFLLSPSGMTKIQQHPSAVWKGVSQSYLMPATIDATLPFICTWPFDFGYAGQKTLQTVEVLGDGFTGGLAAADYNLTGAWATKIATSLNQQNLATVIAAGNLFRIRASFGTLADSFKLIALRARYKMTDLRGIRGVYAPPLRGQSA